MKITLSSIEYYTLKVGLCIFFLVSVSNLYAQTTYKIIYYISEIKFQGSIDNLDDKGKSFTKQVIEQAKDVNYILIANKKNSYFQVENKLTKDDASFENMLSGMAKRFTSFNESVYANHDKENIVFVRIIVNQDFMVKRDYFDFNWIIKNETKKILGFEARKAEGKFYHSVTNDELKVEAWFVPSIPLQFGPDIFMGLPGLIVEVNLKGAVVSVKKIESNLNFEIDKIDDSKAMTEKEYEDLIKSLTKKYIDK